MVLILTEQYVGSFVKSRMHATLINVFILVAVNIMNCYITRKHSASINSAKENTFYVKCQTDILRSGSSLKSSTLQL